MPRSSSPYLIVDKRKLYFFIHSQKAQVSCPSDVLQTVCVHLLHATQVQIQKEDRSSQRDPKVLPTCPLLATSGDKAFEQDTNRDPEAYSDLSSPETQAIRAAFGGSASIFFGLNIAV